MLDNTKKKRKPTSNTDAARSGQISRSGTPRSGQIWENFFFFLKKKFSQTSQIWPDLARSGHIWEIWDVWEKFFFPGTPNDITKYRLKYRSIYVARVCKLRSRTHKVYQTINQSDKRYIIGKLLAPPPVFVFITSTGQTALGSEEAVQNTGDQHENQLPTTQATEVAGGVLRVFGVKENRFW